MSVSLNTPIYRVLQISKQFASIYNMMGFFEGKSYKYSHIYFNDNHRWTQEIYCPRYILA